MRNIKVLALIIAAFYGLSANGQLVNSIYYLDNLPQTSKLNPARMPKCNFYINVMNVNTSLFTELGPQQVLTQDNVVDGVLRMPYYNQTMWDNFVNSLNDPISLRGETEAGLGFGFRAKKGYFHFDISERNIFNVSLDRDILTLNNLGNDVTKDFSSMSFSASAFAQIGLGYAYEVTPQLNVGAKIKILKGLANVNAEFNKAELYTSVDYWQLTGDAEANMSLPVRFELDQDGNIEEVNDSILSEIGIDYLNNYFAPATNFGIATDLGVEYKLLPNLFLSASLIDFGKIWWNHEVSNIKGEADVRFDGIDEDPFLYDDENDVDNYFEEFADSILGGFTSSVTNNNFNTGLAPRLYVGAEYLLNDQISFGVLSNTSFYKQRTMQSVMLSANANLNYVLTAGAHYGFNFGYANTGGFTLGLNILPIQLFFAVDYIPLRYNKADVTENDEQVNLGIVKWDYAPVPVSMNALNVQVGLNFTFGCRKRSNVPIYHDCFDDDVPGLRKL